MSYEEVTKLYKYFGSKIKPSNLISSCFPKNIELCYGVHLRRTDKIGKDSTHQNSLTEFNLIIEKLLVDLKMIILQETEPYFFICSEDISWKNKFINKLHEFSKKNNKSIHIIQTSINEYEKEYKGFNAILDLFCLSKCKKIYQGIKYSTFSMIAALIGNIELINYSHVLKTNNRSLIHCWKSAININGNFSFETDIAKDIRNKRQTDFYIT
jgi:hypothetical protein